jgi:hypothetical protein
MKNVILFYSRSLQNRLYPLISKHIAEFDSVHIVQNDDEYAIVKSIVPDAQIYNLTAYIKTNWTNTEKLNSVSLTYIEDKYDIDGIWKLYYADRFLVKYDYDDSVRFIKLHFLFIDQIIKDVNPAFFVNEEIAMFSAFLFYKVCKKHECKYLGFSVPRNFTYDKFLFTQDEFSHYYELDSRYGENNFNEEDIEKARNIIQEIRNTGTKPEYMQIQGKKPRFHFAYIYAILKTIYFCIFEKTDFFNYAKRKKSSTQLNALKYYIRYNLQKKYYKKPLENQRYLLFPLHFQPEASTLTKATDFENQINTIEILAKNIPGEFMLYVKEHYAKLGHRDMLFYKLLKKFSNVRLIDPWIDSHSLIKKSDGVIVLTSTVGWEALIYGKPVFILGNVFYETFKYSVKVDNIFKLSKLIKEKLKENDIHNFDYDYEFAKYFAAYMMAMKEGHYYLRLSPDDDNIIKLSSELKKELNRLLIY